MRLAAKAMTTAAIAILALGSPALAASVPALGAGGRTVAGPGLVRIPKTMFSDVMKNYFGNDACVTVVNLGNTDVQIDTAGTGPSTAVVTGHQSMTLCQPALTGVTLTCSGTQAGDCLAMWRVDR